MHRPDVRDSAGMPELSISEQNICFKQDFRTSEEQEDEEASRASTSQHHSRHTEASTLPRGGWSVSTAGHRNIWRLDTHSSLTVPIAVERVAAPSSNCTGRRREREALARQRPDDSPDLQVRSLSLSHPLSLPLRFECETCRDAEITSASLFFF